MRVDHDQRVRLATPLFPCQLGAQTQKQYPAIPNMLDQVFGRAGAITVHAGELYCQRGLSHQSPTDGQRAGSNDTQFDQLREGDHTRTRSVH